MDAQQAAERAVEIARQFTVELDSSDEDEHEFVATAFLNDLIAPLLASKDAEISAAAAKWEKNRAMLAAMIDVDSQKLAALSADRDRLAAEVAELRRDAERWRVVINEMTTYEVGNYHFAGKLSEMADAALAAQKVTPRKSSAASSSVR